MSITEIIKRNAAAFGIAIGLILLSLAIVLLIYAPEQTSYLLTIGGLVCSCVSMLLITVDVIKDRQL